MPFQQEPSDREEFVKICVWLIALWAVVFFTAGCASLPPPPQATGGSAPAGSWAYDSMVLWSPAMGLADKGDLCPFGAPNEVFWPALFKATAHEESGWKPTKIYTENFPDSAGHYQVSRGLMQLSYDDEGRGPRCVNLKANILDPKTNLGCSSDIMNQLVKANTEGSLRANLGRYWSTIQDGKINSLLKEYLPDCFAQQRNTEMLDND